MKIILKVLDYFFIGFSFLASKKVVAILVVCLFISLLQVSTGYREELIKKEQEMFYEKGNPNVEFYNEELMVSDIDQNMAVSEMVACYQKGLETEQVSDEIKQYMEELKSLYDEDNANFSFLYQDIYSGFTVSYNEESPIFTASTIKAPAMIYLYELASKGEIDLNEKLVYESKFYTGGSGILKTKEIGTSYTVEELIQYAIHDSDNIAYTMLMNRFKRENVLNFWNNLGTKNIYTLETIWGVTSAKDAGIYMRELYRFSKENSEYGSKLLEYFKNAEWKLLTDKNGEFNTANKGGWSGEAIHDVAIVFEENPYILVVMSKLGERSYSSLFKRTSELVGNLHEEYWKYKKELCGSINLY